MDEALRGVKHPCPVKGCSVTLVPGDKLMCYRHWHMVPQDLRTEVWSYWYHLQRVHRRETTDSYESVLALHTEACKRAIEAVDRQLTAGASA